MVFGFRISKKGVKMTFITDNEKSYWLSEEVYLPRFAAWDDINGRAQVVEVSDDLFSLVKKYDVGKNRVINIKGGRLK